MRKRVAIILGSGLLAGAFLVAGRAALRHQALARVLTADAPTDGAMTDFVATAGEPTESLRQLWDSQRTPQRLFVMAYIRQNARNDAALWRQVRPLVLAARQVGDSDLQESALVRLFEHNDPELFSTAHAFLQSADPEVRLAGLSRLVAAGGNEWISTLARMLDDPEAMVQTAAMGALQARAADISDAPAHVPAERDAAIEAWKKWWSDHRADFPVEPPAEKQKLESPGNVFAFSLHDLAGKDVRLDQFRGKVVLLNFWATWCPPCVEELPTLQALQAKHPDDLVVLGINIDGVPDDDGDEKAPDAAGMQTLRAVIQKTLADAGVTYPILPDAAGVTVGAYASQGLPTSILIGGDGTVRRRLLGARSAIAWESLVREAADQ